jgi:hypothetical protein
LVEYIYAKDKVRVDTKNISIEKYLDKKAEKTEEALSFSDCLNCVFNELYHRDNVNERITNLMKNCYFIGYESDNQLTFVQHDKSLYIINTRTLLQEYFLYLIFENKQGTLFDKLKVKSQYSYNDLITFFKANIDPSFTEGNAKITLNDKLHLLNLLNIKISTDFQISEIFFIDLAIDNAYRKNFLNNLPIFIYSLIEYLNQPVNRRLTENENMNFLIEVCKIYTFYLANIYLQYLNSEQVVNKFLKNLLTELKVNRFFIRKNIKENFLIKKIVDTETLYTVFERC